MDKTTLPIGVFDSGVGGLTVVNKLHMLLPHENIVYLGDTKRNPYGERTKSEIFQFTRDLLGFMTQVNVNWLPLAVVQLQRLPMIQ